ncbi:MAG: hypothetical protein Q8M39_11115 [Sulfuricurvum sp.]|nr:hypothetical protein [Sulfuricurvum sp.]
MKYLAIILFAFVLNLSALNATFYVNEVKTLTTSSIEMGSEKMDVSESSDLYDDPYFNLISSPYIPLDVSNTHLSFSDFYPYEKIFILLEPPESNLFV